MLKFNNRTLKYNSRWLNEAMIPIDLPSYTIRLLYKDGVTPSFTKGTAVQVSESPNIWDLTYMNSDWNRLLEGHDNLLEVLGANSSGVTNMGWMFHGCSSLRTVPLFDTSNVTSMYWMFRLCYALTSVPLFDTSKVTDMGGMFDECSSLDTVPLFDTSNVLSMGNMFGGCTSLRTVPLFDTSNVFIMDAMCYHCYNVESGALALYQQASTQTNPPSNHTQTFKDCGRDTVTGAAELAQIPSDWK